MIIVLIGPPGAGKSKQSELLKEREHVVWLSAGQILRDLNDPVINEVMNRGDLVDDDFVNALVEKHLGQIGRRKVIILDGFPRHEVQAEWLLGYSAETGHDISCVIHLRVTPEVSRHRLESRGEERDNPQSIGERLEEYAVTIEPIVEYFSQANIPVRTVDGDQSIESVFTDIDRIVTDVHQS